MSPYRFCLWGGRRRDVWIGSAEDRMIAAEREAMERWARNMRAAFARSAVSIQEVGAALEQLAIPASKAVERLRANIAAWDRSSARRAQEGR